MTTPKRSETNDVLGVSMSKELKARIKKLADLDHRPMATWCALHLEQLVKHMEAEAARKARGGIKYPTADEESGNHLKVAEDPNLYGQADAEKQA